MYARGGEFRSADSAWAITDSAREETNDNETMHARDRVGARFF
jgi:hypothetical protein